MEIKLKAVSTKQALVKVIDQALAGATEKREIVVEHAKELQDYENVLGKVSIMEEHYADAKAKIAAEKVVIDGYIAGLKTTVHDWQARI